MEYRVHKYPNSVHILNDPYVTHLCAKLSNDSCSQPLFNQFVSKAFKQLFISIMNKEWPKVDITLPTRMTEFHKDQTLTTQMFDPKQKSVCVDIARAGMLPSQVFFDELNGLVDPSGVRQDHIFASRVCNDSGEVTHTELYSSKIGGDVDKAIVFLPDPMGATGNSICEVIEHYKNKVEGQATKFIATHLMVTPEYIKNVTQTHPDVLIYTARLDRGFSSKKALSSAPGTHWNEESGLNDNQYIVPGAGGVGELINNSFV